MMVRGGLAIGMSPAAAMRLALRCARDSIPPLRLSILREVMQRSGSSTFEVSQQLGKPYSTCRRELEGLHVLGLLRCVQDGPGKKAVRRYSLSDALDRTTLHEIYFHKSE
jgi:hypothetical protein